MDTPAASGGVSIFSGAFHHGTQRRIDVEPLASAEAEPRQAPRHGLPWMRFGGPADQGDFSSFCPANGLVSVDFGETGYESLLRYQFRERLYL